MREKELRIALVCFGGVSLAVYMHGISKEILKLIRASAALHSIKDRDARLRASFFETVRERSAEYDTEAVYFDVLREIGRQVDLRVIVDVIAGASAGGLNGATLGRALSHDLPILPLRDSVARQCRRQCPACRRCARRGVEQTGAEAIILGCRRDWLASVDQERRGAAESFAFRQVALVQAAAGRNPNVRADAGCDDHHGTARAFRQLIAAIRPEARSLRDADRLPRPSASDFNSRPADDHGTRASPCSAVSVSAEPERYRDQRLRSWQRSRTCLRSTGDVILSWHLSAGADRGNGPDPGANRRPMAAPRAISSRGVCPAFAGGNRSGQGLLHRWRGAE